MGRDYPFAKLSGTSMSSPVVAGVSALIWEANPYLSPWQIKQILITTSREDIKTGDLPQTGDYYWGYGKINAYAAIQLALNTIGTQDIEQPLTWSIYPNPATEYIHLINIPKNVKSIEIIDMNGKSILIAGEMNLIDISLLPKGVYVLRLVYNQKIQQQKFIHH